MLVILNLFHVIDILVNKGYGDSVNNKGFMMAEVVVVSAIVLVFMTGLYVSYNKLFSQYSIRVNYYDSTTLYDLAYYRDMLIKNDKMNISLDDAKTTPLNIFTGNRVNKLQNSDSVYLIYNRKNKVNKNGINASFSDYIDYLSTAVSFNSNYIMLMERCSNDKCTYAYLEVYDGKE